MQSFVSFHCLLLLLLPPPLPALLQYGTLNLECRLEAILVCFHMGSRVAVPHTYINFVGSWVFVSSRCLIPCYIALLVCSVTVMLVVMMMMMIFLFLTFWLFCPAPDCQMMGVFSFRPSGVLFCFFSILNAFSHLCFVLWALVSLCHMNTRIEFFICLGNRWHYLLGNPVEVDIVWYSLWQLIGLIFLRFCCSYCVCTLVVIWLQSFFRCWQQNWEERKGFVDFQVEILSSEEMEGALLHTSTWCC